MHRLGASYGAIQALLLVPEIIYRAGASAIVHCVEDPAKQNCPAPPWVGYRSPVQKGWVTGAAAPDRGGRLGGDMHRRVPHRHIEGIQPPRSDKPHRMPYTPVRSIPCAKPVPRPTVF